MYSIFNDVLGPVMYGPSSSHSAAPCRIGNLCRQLLNGPLCSAEVEFDPDSSYAATYKFHCSDRGFTAGILGIPVDDVRNLSAFSIAKENDTPVTFQIKEQENKHPNYAKVRMIGKTDTVEIGTISTGGGMLELVSLDDFPICVSGDRWYSFVKNPAAAFAAAEETSVQIQTKGADKLLIVEHFSEKIEGLPSGDWIRHCGPILPVPALPGYAMPFASYPEALAYGKTHGLSAGELGIRYEMARSGSSRQEVLAQMERICDVMHQAVQDSTHRAGGKAFGYYPYRAATVTQNLQKLPEMLKLIGSVSANAAAVFEHTLSVGLVVAAPTGGSCGVLPAAVVELGQQLGVDREAIIRGLFAAGLVGVFICQGATFGCETAGCQAENGSGSAMAAAGVAEMLGGDCRQAFDAAALAMQNTLGLICDPVACAYVPCVSRNAMAAVNAISAASLVLSGYTVYVPLDDTISTMQRVGSEMPACHRCTGGGLNLSPSGVVLNRINSEYIESL